MLSGIMLIASYCYRLSPAFSTPPPRFLVVRHFPVPPIPVTRFAVVWVSLLSSCCDMPFGQMAFGAESLVKISLVNRGVKKQHLSLVSRLCDILLPNVVRQMFCCEVTLQTALDAMKYRQLTALQ